MAADNQNNKRGPGRPPGSKNKNKSGGNNSGSKSKSQGAAVSSEQAKIDKIRAMQEQYDRDRRNLDVIWSITLAAFGIFLLFTVVMNTTGSFGKTVHDICMGLFGIMAYVLPFFVIIFALLLFFRKMQHISGRTVLFSLLIFLNICILNSYRFIDEKALGFGFLEMAQYYFDGIENGGGGAVGMWLGSVLVKFFGMPGLLIIASAILLISIFRKVPVTGTVSVTNSDCSSFEKSQEYSDRTRENRIPPARISTAAITSQMTVPFFMLFSPFSQRVI